MAAFQSASPARQLDLAHHDVDDAIEDVVLVGHVVVEGHRLDAELPGRACACSATRCRSRRQGPWRRAAPDPGSGGREVRRLERSGLRWRAPRSVSSTYRVRLPLTAVTTRLLTPYAYGVCHSTALARHPGDSMKAIVYRQYGSPDVLEAPGRPEAGPQGRRRAGPRPRGVREPAGLALPAGPALHRPRDGRLANAKAAHPRRRRRGRGRGGRGERDRVQARRRGLRREDAGPAPSTSAGPRRCSCPSPPT